MSGAEPEHAEAASAAPPGRADPTAPMGLAPLQEQLITLQRSAGNRAVSALLRARRLARAPKMPGFSQKGDTCGAASLVTSLVLWDLERSSPDNAAIVHACDLVLTQIDTGSPNATAKSVVETVRGLAMTPGHKVGQKEYESLSMALALLYNGKAGMASDDIHKLAGALGFRPFADGTGNTLGDVMASDAVKNLKPGEVGQLNWIIASTGGGHAMALGRHEDGIWFFSDQGPSPPLEVQRPDHAGIVSAVVAYGVSGWLYSGDKRDLQSLPPVTGFKATSGVQSFLNRGPRVGAIDLIKPGDKLAEIDANWSIGETLTAWDYHSRHDSLADAQAAITKDKGHHGGVIVERPKGMFHIYKTNPLKDRDNLKETRIDADDSKEMVLVKSRTRFHSVHLVLSDPAGNKGTPFAV
jgi:hypothetical protein